MSPALHQRYKTVLDLPRQDLINHYISGEKRNITYLLLLKNRICNTNFMLLKCCKKFLRLTELHFN